MNKEILLFIRSLGRGGAERQLVLLARTLKARGHSVKVAVLYREGPFIAELEGAGIPIVDFRKQSRWDVFGVILRIAAYIWANKPALVNSYLPAENVLCLLMKAWIRFCGCKLVCGLRSAGLDVKSYGRTAVALYRAQALLLRFADAVISNSRAGLNEHGRWIRANRAFVIPNGIETDTFGFDANARQQQRREWGLTGQDIAIGVVGRLDHQKNHRLALDAFALFARSRTDAHLVIVGGGCEKYRQELVAHAHALGIGPSVIWAGNASKMDLVYSALDLLCSPSLAEGFPNVLGEAMNCGLPCVVTDVGDCADLVGPCGWVVPNGDVQAMASALGKAVAQLREWDREVSKGRIIEHFGVDALSERTLAVYTALLAEGTPGAVWSEEVPA